MLTADRDLYAVLGVSRDATQEQIHEQYRILVKRYHPDLHPGDRDAEARMEQINEAYDVLGNEEQRHAYDADCADCPPEPGPAAPPTGPQGFGPDAYADDDFRSAWDAAAWGKTSRNQAGAADQRADPSTQPFQRFRDWSSTDTGDVQLTGFLLIGRLLWFVFWILLRVLGLVLHVLNTRLDDHDRFF